MALQEKKGADVNATNKHGVTPLVDIAMRTHRELLPVAKIIVEKGADVSAKDGDGFTALHHAASMRHLALCKLLVDNGADVNALSKGMIAFSLTV